jgi:mannose-1-phosphate guanylyltransferase
MANRISTVVLAAGAGTRLVEVTGGVPKQFWRGPSGRTLLDETLDRFGSIGPAERSVIIVSASHSDYIGGIRGAGRVGRIVVQPADRGTAAGVLLGLSATTDRPDDEPVIITPSDHGIANEGRFRSAVVDALLHVQAFDRMIVFGAEPTAPCTDYGWITPAGTATGSRIRPVAAFVEKPDLDQARRLFSAGSVWNTMVVAARLGTLRALFHRLVPELADTFASLEAKAAADARRLDALYAQLTRPYDFSRDILTPASDLSTLVWPVSIGWSDLGTPDRLWAWHRRLEPASSAPRIGSPTFSAA